MSRDARAGATDAPSGRPFLGRPAVRTTVDVVLLTALTGCALAGLDTVMVGVGHLVVGVLGCLVGGGLAVAVRELGWPRVSVVALTALAYLLLGLPVVLRTLDPRAVPVLAEEAVRGWKDLLTTLPPVLADGPVLALPWLLGLATGAAGMLATGGRDGAGRRGGAGRCLLPPALLLVVVLLLGVDRPASVWVQGVAFVALAVAWLVLREQAARGDRLVETVAQDPVRNQVHPARGVALVRSTLAVGLVLVASLLALPVATGALGAQPTREYLRRHVQPPFDIEEFPSPLAGFRRYVEMPEPDAVNVHDEELLRVRGLPRGTRLRLAVMDDYDGVVWGASDDGPGEPDDPAHSDYRRVSPVLENPAPGRPVTASVRLGAAWEGVWVPVAGAVQGLVFHAQDPATDRRQQSLRYNLSTDAAVVPTGLRRGDRYTLRTVLTDDRVSAGTRPWPSPPALNRNARFLAAPGREWVGSATSPMGQVLAAATYLRDNGFYSDGVEGAERVYHPGHNLARLDQRFVNDPVLMAGNDEQYAAVLALLANELGVPARVVLGAEVPGDGVVRGEDVHAWVEARRADGGWGVIPTETFLPTTPPADQPPQTEEQVAGDVVPPATPPPPPSTLRDLDDSELSARRSAEDADEGFRLPEWALQLLVFVGGPLLLAAGVVGMIVGAKALRRRRRLRNPKVSARFGGAWTELVDHARDLGMAVPVGRSVTRRIQAGSLGESAGVLARRADGHVFGPTAPDAGAAAAFWVDVQRERSGLSSQVGRWARARAAVSLASFRRGRST